MRKKGLSLEEKRDRLLAMYYDKVTSFLTSLERGPQSQRSGKIWSKKGYRSLMHQRRQSELN